MAKWIARNSDNAWMVRDFGDPSLIFTQPGAYTEVEVPGDAVPNPRTERYDASSPTKLRAATAPEIAAYDDAVLTTAVTVAVDQERLTSSIVWTMIDQFLPPATVAKYNAARTKIINFFKTQPWKP